MKLLTSESFRAILVMSALFFGVTSLGAPLPAYQCAVCENQAKTENSVNENYDEIYLHPWQTITGVYIKAGNACYSPYNECYRIKDGGIGFSFVQVERIGDGPICQGISHTEVCYEEDTTPTDTPEAPTETPTNTPTPEDPTNTPDPTETPESTATETQTPEPSVTPSVTPVPSSTPTPCYQCGKG